MTALDTPFNPGQARGQAPQAGRLGIQVTPNAPGMVALPAASQEASRLRQMIDAIGAAGRVASTAGRQADLEVRRREFQQQKFDRLYEASASLEARTTLARIQQEIVDGKHEVPEGVTVADYAKELAAIQLPDDAPDAYKSRYKSILIPAVAQQITAKQADDISQARSESIKMLAEGAYSIAATPEEMLELVDQAKEIDPTLSDLEARAAVLLPAMQVAIEQGDATSFDVVAKALGAGFDTTIASGRIQLEERRLRNDQRQDSERMKEATRIIDALANSPHTTDQIVADSINGMDLDATQKQTLRSRAYNIKAEQLAVQRSQRRQLVESIHDRAKTPQELRSALDRNAQSLGLNEREIDREVLVFAEANIELAATQGDLDRIDELAPFLGDGPEAKVTIETAKAAAVNSIRARRFNSLVTGLQAGKIDTEQLRKDMTEDAQRALEDPDSPDVLSTSQRDNLMRAVGKVEQLDLSMERVGRAMAGDGRVVITRQDDEAIDQMLGSKAEGGAGLIDEQNNITDPMRLGLSLATFKRVTPATRDVIMTNLMQGQPDQQVQAIQTIAAIAQSRPGLLGDLAGDDLKAGSVIAAIRFEAERNTAFQNPAVARERIAAIISDIDETSVDTRAADTKIKEDNIRIEGAVEDVMNSAAKLMPWRNPPGAFNQADLVDPGDEATRFLSNAYKQQYLYQRDLGKSKSDADESARSVAQELFIRNFDYVRFNGELHIQRIDNGKRRLREDFRWGEGYDKSIESFVEDKGYELDDVFTVRPISGVNSDGQRADGWQLIDINLDPITDDQGNILIWQPPAKLRDKSVQDRNLLEAKAAEFEQDREDREAFKERVNRQQFRAGPG